jgi:hypothetical protein
MIIATNPAVFNIQDVYYCKPIRNKIMSGGMFIRLIYSNHLASINGIHVSFSITGRVQEIYSSKFKFFYENDTDNYSISLLQDIENNLLNSADIKHRNPQYKLREQLSAGFFKFFQNNITKSGKINNATINTTFVLKISGIWTTDTSYGITYKFTRVS